MGPREAVALISDKSTCLVAGISGNQRISILAWSLREVFQETKHPRNLTIISAGGQGGRGRAPGTLEELGLPGLVTRFISAHHETYKAFLQLADQGKMELQCIPQGVMALLVEAISEGRDHLLTSTGLGTFCDPEVGTGSNLFNSQSESLVSREKNQLKFTLPKLDIVMFNAPAADEKGNIYIDNCTTICEAKEAAIAVKKQGGKVIVNVGRVIPQNLEQVYLSTDHVDAIVYYPKTEQTASFYHRKPWTIMTTSSKSPALEGLDKVRFFNQLAGVTPQRGKLEKSLATIGAHLIHEKVPEKSWVNVGTGLPEEVCYVLQEKKWLDNMTLFTEAGAIGGVPAPGLFFGAAVNPEKIVSSPKAFRLAQENLEATILGFLEVDSEGNVNASQRGDKATQFVGPGGFIDFTCTAKQIFFIGSWMARGKVKLNKGKVKIEKQGRPKFVEKVRQITFHGKKAIAQGQKVYFITHVGVFHLTEKGVELMAVMPGISIEKDILAFSPMKIVIPEKEVPVITLE